MVHIAVLGYGVVGSGVWLALQRNRARIGQKAGCAVAVKRVLDLRDFPDDPVRPFLTHDINDILNDPQIRIVAEVMGGTDPAYDYVKRALLAGKHVCTSNKELVIRHGAELLALARERELNFMFEASVGGGIPIVRPMNLALTTDEVTAVAGILNGTSNYILTRMDEGVPFADALAEAQAKGYAERDPQNDVGGADASRKLAILLSLAAGRTVRYEDIATVGITALSPADFAFARRFGCTVKLLAEGRLTGNGAEAHVGPMLVPAGHPLAGFGGVYNGVFVQTGITGDLLFAGPGAGQLPTAGAVVSDIVDIAKHLHRHIWHSWSAEVFPVLPASEYTRRRMVRAIWEEGAEPPAQFIPPDAVRLPGFPNQAAWLTPPEAAAWAQNALEALSAQPEVKDARMLCVYEPLAGEGALTGYLSEGGEGPRASRLRNFPAPNGSPVCSCAGQ